MKTIPNMSAAFFASAILSFACLTVTTLHAAEAERPNIVLILEANALRENPSGPKSLNKNQFFKEPFQFDGYYFKPSGKPGLGYEYDEKFVVSRKRLA